ncbi:hypothetical protein TBLA_0F00560 [Henningerozyma blattae CBS 6284]|uniref:Hexaprenyl pyrophosphate synthase, mitochondrial n=1 Tax=Henningerozyma blattae (strain ATCC 34711 / CBS 6284 / DSM 70876 / NBRC 10599 / NRRL Y-10934 / UCD 77-7) TaxID=1071380 RepID=I2H5E8_HENB6|nr:hypothetical protein TBLA_0F00560 [Tetrapisispora blattae CBS 6284]CCH61600.1 hypothetical protein TBLA_0F00560 [Tetrapisispora blattae CBS 6284]
MLKSCNKYPRFISSTKIRQSPKLIQVRCRIQPVSTSSFATAISAARRLVTPAYLLNNPLSVVSEEMNTLVKNIVTLIGSGHPILNRMTGYYFDAEGKKVRPLLVLLLSKAISNIPLNERANITRFDSNDVSAFPISMKFMSLNLFDNPKDNFSPIQILNGIKPLNPLTNKADTTFQSTSFDKKNGILPKQRRLAEIVEMIHTASLLHDDVIDHSPTRRGNPSGNVAFTNKMAVLAGDFLLGRATVCISRLENPEVVELMSNSIANLVEGEFMQLKNMVLDSDLTSIDNGKISLPIPSPKFEQYLNDSNSSVIYQSTPQISSVKSTDYQKQDKLIDIAFDYYLHKTYLKTGSLIAMACRSSAVLAGVNDSVVEQCFEFGKNIGICFQLVDDLLDFSIPSKTLGKPAGADLKLGIATAPVLFAWKHDHSLGKVINRNFSEIGDVEIAATAVETYNGVELTRKLAEDYRDKALENLRSVLPESDARSALEFLTNSILTRKK